ncbi:MAG: HU family DNA-binding protein [Methylobacteriaceae bacterium]|nr:HU family DNA-binding protein [Methylobacteriaceae bacterium]
MNKLELVDAVAREAEMTKTAAGAAVDAALAAIAGALAKGEEVRLAGFGAFSVSERAATTGRNPSTGAEIQIPASRNARFKASATLKASLNGK